MEDVDTALQFLPATDSKPLEKMSGRRKKLWLGVGLLLLAVAVALMTGLLVWHFNREPTPSILDSELIRGCEKPRSDGCPAGQTSGPTCGSFGGATPPRGGLHVTGGPHSWGGGPDFGLACSQVKGL